MSDVREGDTEEFSVALRESVATDASVVDAAFAERSPQEPGDSAVVPDELARATSLVERRACESPDDVSTLVEVAKTECGWWLLAELAGRTSGEPPEESLVESLARATGRSAESVFETLHTTVLPRLLVSDLAVHVDSVASPPEYDAAVELRSDADRELVSAVLLLTAGAAELAGASEGDAPPRPGRDDGEFRGPVERFSTVVGLIRDASRRTGRSGLASGSTSSP